MLFVLFPIVYIVLVSIWLVAWIKLKQWVPYSEKDCSIKISIVVAARNESDHLPDLIKSFEQLNYPKELFEVIVVDDHSDDHTAQMAEQLLKEFDLYGKVKSLHNSEGKKSAIEAGVQLAQGDLIVTTDADCIHHPDWLRTIGASYRKGKAAILIMPVVLQGKGFFARLQYMESIGLAGLTGGSLAIGKPLMCNGANMAFEKRIYQEMNFNAIRADIPSGDDTFFMLSFFAKNPKRVMFIKAKTALVYSKSQPHWNSFVNQRIRWASKVKFYHQFYIKAIGAFLSFYSVLQLYAMAALILWCYGNNSLMIPLIILIARLVADGIFIKVTSHHLQQKFDLPAFLILFFCYPFYSIYIFIISLFKGYVWKGRTVK